FYFTNILSLLSMRKGFTLTFLSFLFSIPFLGAQTLEVAFDVTSPEELRQVGTEIGIGADNMNFQFQNRDCFAGEMVWAYAYTDSTETAIDSLMCAGGPVANADEVAGKFALIRRGECFFSDKIYQAQLAGAIGAVICNNNLDDRSEVINMSAGGDFEALDTIPSIFLSYNDCAAIDAVLAAGGTVEVKAGAEIAVFLDAASAFSYHTPESQIIPLDAMNVTLANASLDEAVEATTTVTITDPLGDVTEFTVGATIPASSDTILAFPEYIPAGGIGMYQVDFTSNLSEDTLSQPFVITEYTFATDNGNITRGVGPGESLFEDSNLIYNAGALANTGDQGATATFATFGIANAGEVATGDASADVVNVVLYEGDSDGDGGVDVSNSFDDLIPIALGEYVINGEEGQNELLDVQFISLDGTEGGIELAPNSPYYTTIQYNGQIAGVGVAPEFLATDLPNYPAVLGGNEGVTTPIFLDQFYGGGWTGTAVVVRLQLEGYTPPVSTSDVVLETSKLNIAPNPATDFVNIDFAFDTPADEVRLNLLDVQGRLVKSVTVENILNDTYRFDISDLSTGTYLLSVRSPEGVTARKVMVTK
ncbi:MAG: PA domain-containing protein, partial [Bacteroidota bacterium]